jgi:hypothetical protein
MGRRERRIRIGRDLVALDLQPLEGLEGLPRIAASVTMIGSRIGVLLGGLFLPNPVRRRRGAVWKNRQEIYFLAGTI